MMQKRQHAPSVFFTGVPLAMDKSKLRQHFDSVGHTIDFRVMGPDPGKNFRYGVAEYMDGRTAEEAVTRLDNTMFGDCPMRVRAAQQQQQQVHTMSREWRKRGREVPALPHSGVSQPHDRTSGDLLIFPRCCADPLLGREDSTIIASMRGMTVKEAYEAVEQLRVLALERPDEARLLLEECPPLRSAVVLILQHAGRVPYGPLSPDAFKRNVESNTATTSTTTTTTSTKDMNASPASAVRPTVKSEVSSNTPAQRNVHPATDGQKDEVINLVRQMREEDIERILLMTNEDLAAVSDPQQRSQLGILRNRLLEMSSSL